MNTRQPDGPPEDTIQRAWRDASAERPPDRVDAAILAAARSAVDAGKASRHGREWLHGWQPMLAAAAVAGIAFVLVQTLPREPGIATPSAGAPQAVAPPREAPLEAPRELPATSVPQSEPVPPPSVSQPASRRIPREPERAVEAPPVATGVVPAPPPTVASPSAASTPALDAASQGTATAEAAPAAARQERAINGGLMSKAGAPQAVSADAAIASSIRRIVDLYERGDTAAAAAELRHARTLTPTADDRLPEPLRAWARAVPQ